MSKDKEIIIMPGQEIAIEEQYVAGKNTFSDKGAIKSLVIGKMVFDEDKKEVKVEGYKVKTISIGDVVYAKVTNVKDSMIMVELKSAENNKKITSTTAMIPVRNISTEYVSNSRNAYRIGDLVRAKVVSNTILGIDLATNEKGLGVIKAYCSNCRSEMSYSNEKLLCFSCGSLEERKWHEAEQQPREFNSQRNTYEERNGFGRPSFGNGFRGRDNNRRFDNRNRSGFNRRENQKGFGNRNRF